jgi:DUF1365 family protein
VHERICPSRRSLSNDRSYQLHTLPPAADVLVAFDEKERSAPVPAAIFAGKWRELTDLNLVLTLLRHPLMTIKIVVAIHFEAVRLRMKRVPLHAAPGLR